jgi:CBS domain
MTGKVIWVEPDTPFAAIAAALHEFRVSAFPVLDDKGQVIGVVSESDLLPVTSRASWRSATASTTRRPARTPSTWWPASRSTERTRITGLAAATGQRKRSGAPVVRLGPLNSPIAFLYASLSEQIRPDLALSCYVGLLQRADA